MSAKKINYGWRAGKCTGVSFTALVLVITFCISAVAQGVAGSKKGGTSKSRKPVPMTLGQLKVPGLKFSEKIPTNFPMPEYPRNVLKKSFVHSTKGSPSASANIITKDSAQVVFKWYQAVCKRGGWKVRIPKAQTITTGKNSKLYLIDAVKGHNSISISCYKCMDPSLKGTSINIAWSFLGN